MASKEDDPGAQQGPSLQRDGVVLAIYVELVVLLYAGLTGTYHIFGYTLAVFLGTLVAMGFVRRADAWTWAPALVSTAFLIFGLTGVFLNETAVITSEEDTAFGFHPAVAFLVYVIWIPSFFIVGLGYTLAFSRLYGALRSPRRARPTSATSDTEATA